MHSRDTAPSGGLNVYGRCDSMLLKLDRTGKDGWKQRLAGIQYAHGRDNLHSLSRYPEDLSCLPGDGHSLMYSR